MTLRVRDIPGWPGYSATEDGTVIGPSGATLKPWAHWRTGHLRVRLYGSHAPMRAELVRGSVRARRCSSLYVHTLVALAWHGLPPEGATLVRHLDDDPQNNRPWNLRWGTRAQNEADKHRDPTAFVDPAAFVEQDSVDEDGFDWASGELARP